jgi:MoaA/NifB/PqqE/SkfB family radical SAM enzyme
VLARRFVRRPAKAVAKIGIAYMIEKTICCYGRMGTKKIVWQINDECPIGCPYCFTSMKYSGCKDVAAALGVLEVLRGRYPSVGRLLIAGREPLIYPGILDIVSKASALGYRTSLSTSGELLRIELVKQLVESGLWKVNVTVNSLAPEEHERFRPGSCFGDVLAGIRNAVAAGIRVKANITAFADTCHQVVSTCGMLGEMGVADIGVSFAQTASGGLAPSGDQIRGVIVALEAEPSLNESHSDHRLRVVLPSDAGSCVRDPACPARHGMIAVLPDGSVRGCNIHSELEVQVH